MALPASGTISISDIRTELNNAGKTGEYALSSCGIPPTRGANQYTPKNQVNTTTGTNFAQPYAISEWYSYNHSLNGSCGTNYTSQNVGAGAQYWRVVVTGQTGWKSTISISMASYTSGSLYMYLYTIYPFTTDGDIITTSRTLIANFAGNGTTTYTYTLTSASDVLYFVAFDNSVA